MPDQSEQRSAIAYARVTPAELARWRAKAAADREQAHRNSGMRLRSGMTENGSVTGRPRTRGTGVGRSDDERCGPLTASMVP